MRSFFNDLYYVLLSIAASLTDTSRAVRNRLCQLMPLIVGAPLLVGLLYWGAQHGVSVFCAVLIAALNYGGALLLYYDYQSSGYDELGQYLVTFDRMTLTSESAPWFFAAPLLTTPFYVGGVVGLPPKGAFAAVAGNAPHVIIVGLLSLVAYGGFKRLRSLWRFHRERGRSIAGDPGEQE